MRRMVFCKVTKIKAVLDGKETEVSFGVGEVINLKWVEGQLEDERSLVAEHIPQYFDAITESGNKLYQVPLSSVRREF